MNLRAAIAILLVLLFAPLPAKEKTEAIDFNSCVLQTIRLVENGGGYYTGRKPKAGMTNNAWEGMDRAVILEKGTVTVDLSEARPSFCSSAVYLVLLKALAEWDTDSAISYEAWVNLKPYTVEGRDWPIQADGVGCWGRANANGPGLAVLAEQLHAGTSTYLPPKTSCASEEAYFSLWKSLEPGDFLKLFWNETIGAEGTLSESGHMTVFLRFEEFTDEHGQRDGIVYYWSSNGSGCMPDKGYGIGKARLSEIVRAVATRIEDPAAFNNAAAMMPDDTDAWLSSLDGRHVASEEELIRAIGGEADTDTDRSGST